MSHISFRIKKKIKRRIKKLNKGKNKFYFNKITENNSKNNSQIIYNKKNDLKVFLIILGLVIFLGFSLKIFYNLF